MSSRVPLPPHRGHVPGACYVLTPPGGHARVVHVYRQSPAVTCRTVSCPVSGEHVAEVVLADDPGAVWYACDLTRPGQWRGVGRDLMSLAREVQEAERWLERVRAAQAQRLADGEGDYWRQEAARTIAAAEGAL